MDILPYSETTMTIPQDLTYDDVTPIDEAEQPSFQHRVSETELEPSLASRIGTTKVYFMPDPPAGSNRAGKRKQMEEDADDEEEDVVPANTSIRENAIYLNGTPISHLPTNNIFAYATSLDTKPTALEWIDDTSCVLVFPTRAAARTAYSNISKSVTEDISEDGFFTAKPIPIALWPPESRISSSLGKGEGLKGTMRLRWATPSDIKKRGANKQSEFYKRYGRTAGREENAGDLPTAKRQRTNITEEDQKAELDQELDEFLTEDKETTPPSPPSKMRSDHMESTRRDLQSRLSDSRGNMRKGMREWDEDIRESVMESRGSLGDRIGNRRSRARGGERRGGRTVRPKKTVEDLDAELDSFLKGGPGQN